MFRWSWEIGQDPSQSIRLKTKIKHGDSSRGNWNIKVEGWIILYDWDRRRCPEGPHQGHTFWRSKLCADQMEIPSSSPSIQLSTIWWSPCTCTTWEDQQHWNPKSSIHQDQRPSSNHPSCVTDTCVPATHLMRSSRPSASASHLHLHLQHTCSSRSCTKGSPSMPHVQ